MATIMEKDVLLECTSIGYLTQGMEMTPEIDKDLTDMGKLWGSIMDTDPQDIDYEETFKKIKAIRSKYERN